ncbi:MAG: DUF3427 domain-containing protein [Clostridia bacterium]|nr:DUF3427 domain-containing protein [Clostridia bacterium]
MLKNGLYEQLVNCKLEQEITTTDKQTETARLDGAEASKILARYIAEVAEQGLNEVLDNNGDLDTQVALANRMISVLNGAQVDGRTVSEKAEQLLSVTDLTNTAGAVTGKYTVVRPETSLARSSLFTGAPNEPQMMAEFKKEIVSCNRIDMLVSFIKWSGLRRIYEELSEFTHHGGQLRIITTSYMGATDLKAVTELAKLPNTTIKVNYDTRNTGLHAKTYVFYRDTGYSTAYVGSSNLSNKAITYGLEWNVKLTRKDLPETLEKIEATFETYWNSSSFELYDESQQERLAFALKQERSNGAAEDTALYQMDIRPYGYQQEILDRLAAERNIRDHWHNLVVAATGTGKTVISALDYRRFVHENPKSSCRLLFVAHREEILKQSLYTFRAVLKDANFGDLFVGNYTPNSIEHLFVSIQTLNARELTEKTTPDFYDYIVVDEFHHAAADSYRRMLDYYKPKILLGLTATPERMDGISILDRFDGRIAAEIRLPEAIERQLLCPFQYFGVTDIVDLSKVKWAQGGYDRGSLSNLYCIDAHLAERRAEMVISSVLRYVTDIGQVKGLGFCVTVEHAAFMSKKFNDAGIPSICLSGKSPDAERREAKNKLVSGEVRFIFVVDLYNEGVDIPEVNTVLFLRPTESLTVFLQQLGRGLRLAEGKDCLTVLDFIGQAHKRYNFEQKFAALLSGSGHPVREELKNGFISVPKGCYIQLEKLAAEYVLQNIRASLGGSAGLIEHIRYFEEDAGQALTLANYCRYYHIEPRNIYKYDTFRNLCVRAERMPAKSEALDDIAVKVLSRFCSADSKRWLDFLLTLLPQLGTVRYDALTPVEQRMLNMFVITVWQNKSETWTNAEKEQHLRLLAGCPCLVGEMTELLCYNREEIDFMDAGAGFEADCPLDVYCTYSRDQLFAALDVQKPSTIREGVKWLPDKKADVFLVTLNKSEKHYSPTTMYQDYSISEELFKWQSQSTTTEASPTGQRYIHHREQGTRILLFVREYKNHPADNSACAYTFLGTARYVSHENEKPMDIIWHLDHPIPAKYLKKTGKLVAN